MRQTPGECSVGRRSVTPGEAGRKPALQRLAILARGLRLQARALILLVPPHPITTAARPVAVLLALQVAIDPIAADPDRAAVREHLNVAVDLDPIDPHRAALFELDVAANPRIATATSRAPSAWMLPSTRTPRACRVAPRPTLTLPSMRVPSSVQRLPAGTRRSPSMAARPMRPLQSISPARAGVVNRAAHSSRLARGSVLGIVLSCRGGALCQGRRKAAGVGGMGLKWA